VKIRGQAFNYGVAGTETRMTLVDGEGRHRMKGLWGVGTNTEEPGCANTSNALEDRAGVAMTLLRAPGASARYSGDRPARARIASGKNGRLVQLPTAFSGLAMGKCTGAGRNVLFLIVGFRETIQDPNPHVVSIGREASGVERHSWSLWRVQDAVTWTKITQD
jgi:hypothetical protein